MIQPEQIRLSRHYSEHNQSQTHLLTSVKIF